MVWATVYTDASHYPPTNTAAYAVWAKTDGARMEHAAKCPDEINDATVAEFFSIYAGIYHALRWWPGLSGVHVVNDCQHAVAAFAWDTWKLRTELHELDSHEIDDDRDRLVHRAYKLLNEHNAAIVTRWVSSHQGADGGKRGWVNNRVDKLAYEAASGRKRTEAQHAQRRRRRRR